MGPVGSEREKVELRFAAVFAHLGAVRAYAARRGSSDPDGIAAETMTIAWRRLADVPVGDARPWVFATARNLLLAEFRRARRGADAQPDRPILEALAVPGLSVEIESALGALSDLDREALVLVAWEELTPTEAAAVLGISAITFRVRLMRARKRFKLVLRDAADTLETTTEVGTA